MSLKNYEIRKFSVSFPGQQIMVDETTRKSEWSKEFTGIYNPFINEIYRWYDYKVAREVWSGVSLASYKDEYYCVVHTRKPHFPMENRFIREILSNTNLKGLMLMPDKRLDQFRFFDGKKPSIKLGSMDVVLPPVIQKFMSLDSYKNEIETKIKSEIGSEVETLVIQNSIHAIEALMLSARYKKIFIIENNPVFKYSIDRNLELNKTSNVTVFKGNLHKFDELSGIRKYDLWVNNFKKSCEIKKINVKKIESLFCFGYEELCNKLKEKMNRAK